MKAEKLHRMCRVLYPGRIDIAKARILDETHVFIPELSRAWDRAEHMLSPHDVWRQVGVRAFRAALEERAIRDRKRGRTEVRTSTITLEDFDLAVRLSLRGENWTPERRAWRAANGRRLTTGPG